MPHRAGVHRKRKRGHAAGLSPEAACEAARPETSALKRQKVAPWIGACLPLKALRCIRSARCPWGEVARRLVADHTRHCGAKERREESLVPFTSDDDSDHLLCEARNITAAPVTYGPLEWGKRVTSYISGVSEGGTLGTYLRIRLIYARVG